MPAAITDLIDRVTDSTTGRPVIGSLAAPGKAIAAPSVNVADVTNWTTTTAIHFSIYKTMVVSGVTVKDPTTQTDWKGTLAGTTISNMTITGGIDRAYVAGDIIELTPTARFQKDLYDLLITLFNQDATLKPAPIQTALGLGAATLNGWNALGYTPSTVTALGNRSYQMVYNAVDLTGTISPATRLRTTRTVAAPTQCTNLNGTTQYYSKTSPNGMTFTDDFVVGAWVKLSSYAGTSMVVASRFDGNNGWRLTVEANGQVLLVGTAAAPGNYNFVTSYQSVPLNKWVHIAAQLDMSAFTATTTTSYVMIDGIDVPATVTRGGTNPTAFALGTGAFQIGAANGANFFPGKIAQPFVSSAKITQANIATLYSQGLTSALITSNSIVSAYSFDNNINDLNTTNANNLTPNGSAVATTADSPFGTQASGAISPTLDYAIVQAATFSTNTTVTVQVPEGCTIPTSGGVSTVVYSANKAPYGMPVQRGKWAIGSFWIGSTLLSLSASTWNSGRTANGQLALNIPIGEWDATLMAYQYSDIGSTTNIAHGWSISPSSSAPNPDKRFVGEAQSGNGSGTTVFESNGYLRGPISTSSITPYYAVFYATLAGNHQLNVLPVGGSYLEAENAYL